MTAPVEDLVQGRLMDASIETLVAQRKAWRGRARDLRNALEQIVGYCEGSSDVHMVWILERAQRAVDERQVMGAAALPGGEGFEILARDLTLALDGVLGTESDEPGFEEKWDLAEATYERAREALGMTKGTGSI